MSEQITGQNVSFFSGVDWLANSMQFLRNTVETRKYESLFIKNLLPDRILP